MQKLWKTMGFLVVFILICSVAARLLSGGETLNEYAQKNPETAYTTPTAAPAATTNASPNTAPAAATEASPEAAPTAALNAPSDALTGETEMAGAESVTEEPLTHFYYEPLSAEIIARITGISYPVSETIAPTHSLQVTNIIPDNEFDSLAISYEELRYLNILYYDFNGEVQTGELICNEAIAQDLLEIFYELYLNEYQIERICLIDEYGGDDTASMADNNTSCFNYRVVDGTSSLSKHALGCAIDINPFYNPYVVYNKDGSGETYISPPGSEIYADRTQDFPYKIDENDLCYKLFTEHGFTWGGNWNSSKDYQHFQKMPGSN